MKVSDLGDGAIALVLDEVFDFNTVEEFRKNYQQIDVSTASVVNVDFKSTKYMDSAALGMLLNAQHHFKGRNIVTKITNPNERIEKILTISRFDKKFTIE